MILEKKGTLQRQKKGINCPKNKSFFTYQKAKGGERKCSKEKNFQEETSSPKRKCGGNTLKKKKRGNANKEKNCDTRGAGASPSSVHSESEKTTWRQVREGGSTTWGGHRRVREILHVVEKVGAARRGGGIFQRERGEREKPTEEKPSKFRDPILLGGGK